MSRGGKREGSGRRPGSRNRPKLVLTGAPEQKPKRLSRADQQRRVVCLCVADDMAHDAIAAVLGITPDELQSCFARELQFGRAIIRAETLANMSDASANGSTPAIRQLESVTAARAPGIAPRPAPPQGKKAQADDAAHQLVTSGSRFAPPPPPRFFGNA